MAAFELPALPYAYEALEPVISAEIMRLHHTKHHQAYVNNLNAALEKFALAEKNQDLPTMLALEGAIRFNGGGHINHSIFWTNLAPKDQGGGTPPSGYLMDAIEMDFGSMDSLIEKMSALAISVQGSGWVWLGWNKAQRQLNLITCPNQDALITQGIHPLLGIDVWEHAYYPQYKNARADYVKAIWQVINWKNVEERFVSVASQCCTSCHCR